jgi:pyridoxal 5'-phosphate synthase pdxS subunit
MIRTKGEPGTGDVAEAVRHLRAMRTEMRALRGLGGAELVAASKRLGAPLDLVTHVAREGRLPVPEFAAGGIATPADAALCIELGAESVFVGSGIFLSGDAPKRARAIVSAVTHHRDAKKLAEISEGLGAAMRGIETSSLRGEQRMAPRGL